MHGAEVVDMGVVGVVEPQGGKRRQLGAVALLWQPSVTKQSAADATVEPTQGSRI